VWATLDFPLTPAFGGSTSLTTLSPSKGGIFDLILRSMHTHLPQGERKTKFSLTPAYGGMGGNYREGAKTMVAASIRSRGSPACGTTSLGLFATAAGQDARPTDFFCV